MRRLLAAAAITATLLLGAGCSSGRSGTPAVGAPSAGTTAVSTPNGGAGTSPGAVIRPAGGNAKEVCAAATKASSEAAKTFVSELATMLKAAGANDAKGAQAAQKGAQRSLDSWAAQLKQQAGKATDPQLKALLDQLSAEVGKMKADVDSVDDVKLEQLQQRLDQLCAG